MTKPFAKMSREEFAEAEEDILAEAHRRAKEPRPERQRSGEFNIDAAQAPQAVYDAIARRHSSRSVSAHQKASDDALIDAELVRQVKEGIIG